MYTGYVRKKIEPYLVRSMTFLGLKLEKVVAGVLGAKKRTIKPSGIQPISSIEEQLSESKLDQIVKFASDKIVISTTPNLADKVVLDIGESSGRYVRTLREYGAGVVVQLEGGADSSRMKHPGDRRIYAVKTNLESLPIEDEFFDYIIASLATKHQKDVVKVVKEFGRVLQPGGFGLLFDYHPFGRYAISGEKRVKSVKTEIKGLEDYYKICRVASLRVVEVKESFFDDSVRNMFTTESDRRVFQDIKNTPFLICLMVTKAKKAA